MRIRRRKSNHRHHHRCNHGRKVGGDLKWDGCRTSSFISSVPSPSPTVTPSLFHPFPSLLRFSPPLNVARRFGAGFVRLRTLPSAKKRQSVAKSWRGPNVDLVPVVSEAGGDASRGSLSACDHHHRQSRVAGEGCRRVAAPRCMATANCTHSAQISECVVSPIMGPCMV